MKAVYLLAPKEIEIRDIPVPVPSDGEVLVRISGTYPNRTDRQKYRNRYI